MGLGEDLSAAAVEARLPGRPVRSYPAVLSTEADALAWARGGAPAGALVTAGYQAAPRGRAGLEWETQPDGATAFSLVVRPRLPAEREGWLYTVATCALADVAGGEAAIAWPDEVWRSGRRVAAAGVHAELGPAGIAWAVVTVLLADARPPRAPLVARVVEAIEARLRAASADVLADYTPRCRTIGEAVRARLVPLGPGGPEVTGTAVAALKDGAVVLGTAEGRRVAVRPQHLGRLDQPATAADAASHAPPPGPAPARGGAPPGPAA